MHLRYYALPIETCRSAELSHADPLMRGCAPLIVARLAPSPANTWAQARGSRSA